MKKWPWLLYGIFLTLTIFSSLGDLFSKDSDFKMYYTILTAFDHRYILFLILNIISILINLLAPLVVFLYACEIKTSIKFWWVFFWIRLIFDLIGHHYNLQPMKASFYQSFPYGLACLGFYIIPILPSYIAHYLYILKKPATV